MIGSMKLAVVCDDLAERREAWVEAIKTHDGDFEVVDLDKAAFRDALKVLDRRRREARGQPLAAGLSGQCVFDQASLLFVDYDLIDFDESVTGEMVAYLARCYSTCGTIIGLNQFGESPFDLTLVGHSESFADLNLGGRQLSNPGLWRPPFVGFRPWSWPLISHAAEEFEQRISALVDHLEEGVLDYFGLRSVVAQIPRSSKEFLGVSQKAEDVTFESFVRDSGNGLHPKDGPSDRMMIARVAAARLHRWLERLVLAGQDFIVDAPHLALRFPSLIQGDRDDVTAWDATAKLRMTELEASLKTEVLAEGEFSQPDWLSRPGWYWFKVRETDEFKETTKNLDAGDPFVFCEDLSRFLPREATKEFVSDVPSAYVRRFALNGDSAAGRAFLDRERAREGWDDDATDPTEMDYRPAVRFAL